jgi:hypothetical protein
MLPATADTPHILWVGPQMLQATADTPHILWVDPQMLQATADTPHILWVGNAGHSGGAIDEAAAGPRQCAIG